MKITKIILCFEDMDRIVVEPGHSKDGIISVEEQLKKYNLSKVTGYDLRIEVSPEEFLKLRLLNQTVITMESTGTMNYLTEVEIRPAPVERNNENG